MKVPFWSPGRDFQKYEQDYMQTIRRVLLNGDLILRDDVAEFENRFADAVGTKYAVGVASGTDALFLSLKVLGIGKGDEVIVPGYTFRATIEAVHHSDAKPVLVDFDEDFRRYITKKTKAIMPAHIAGAVKRWIHEPIPTIEDACQAVTAAPVYGLTACYSFYPAKILGCFGDGGAIATNDDGIYRELIKMRNHYKGDWSKYGYNSRLDNLQAAILNLKLKRLPAAIERRKVIALMYDQGLSGLPLVGEFDRDVYQDYIVTLESVERRDSLHDFLAMKGIGTLKDGYPFPDESPKPPHTAIYESHRLRLPCNPELKNEEVEYVIERIQQFYN